MANNNVNIEYNFLLLAMLLAIIMYAGDPDLHDAIMYFLMGRFTGG